MRRRPAEDTTDDAALDGRLRLLQPRRGHRFGHDAILLAAATPARPGDLVVDLGAGVGTAGLAVAARVAGVRLALVEVDDALAYLAMRNAERNGYAERTLAAALDVAAPAKDFAKAGLAAGVANCVIMNPPFREAGRSNPSTDRARRAAHIGGIAILEEWIKTAERLLRIKGRLTVVYGADGLDTVLTVLSKDFGGVAVMPIYPKPGAAAIRIIVGAVKGSRQPMRLLPGLCLNDADGRPTQEAENVMRGLMAIDLGG